MRKSRKQWLSYLLKITWLIIGEGRIVRLQSVHSYPSDYALCIAFCGKVAHGMGNIRFYRENLAETVSALEGFHSGWGGKTWMAIGLLIKHRTHSYIWVPGKHQFFGYNYVSMLHETYLYQKLLCVYLKLKFS